MPFSIDGIPIVGELAEAGYPNLWLATGFGPHGIMEGPAAGRFVGEAVVAQQHRCAGGAASSITDHGIHRVLAAALADASPCRFSGHESE